MRFALASLLVGCILVPRLTDAQDFRIDTKVFVKREERPRATIRTLFVGAMAYDFILGKNEEVTILDPARGRFILLSVPRKKQTRIPLQRVFEMALSIRNRVPDASGVFDPQFTEQQQAGRISLVSRELTYHCDGEAPKHENAVSRYEYFANWNARLNSLQPRNLPSFGRVKLNEAVAKKGWVPTRVQREVKWRNRSLPDARSEHAYVWQLAASDRNRLALVQEQLATFKHVPFDEYLGKKQAAAAPKAQ